jgi:DNA-binding NarL/FixJ family response regulator
MLRFLIADDHEIVRRGLKQILLEGFSVVHIEEVSDGAMLVDKAINDKWILLSLILLCLVAAGLMPWEK